MYEWEGNLVGHIVMDDLARSRSVRTSITTAGYYSTVTGTVHLKVDGANNEERFRSLIRSSTPSFWLTYTFQIIIRTWRWGVSDQKMVCSWQEQDRVLCQVLFRFLKYLLWAGKEFKVKKDFQPWFAERKAHWSESESIRFPPNSCAHPWKFPWFQWIFMDGRKSSGGSGSIPAHSNGLFAQRTTVGNLFWLWPLFLLKWGILNV